MIFSFAAPFNVDNNSTLQAATLDAALYEEPDNRFFRIRAANSAGVRSSVNILVDRMYAWRGYRLTGPAAQPKHGAQRPRITLEAVEHDDTVGTISVGFDGPDGLLVDELFPEEAARLRADGKKICEFTKLAVDCNMRSKRVLASLFHVAYIYAHRLYGCDALLIEVNPRHVRYYEKMLGFAVAGPERLNRRVNAPAVLLCLDLHYCREQILQHQGTGADTCERSLYPYSFTPAEEAGIIARITRSLFSTRTPPASGYRLQYAA